MARTRITSPGNMQIYESDEVEFMMAMERYKREHRRPYPTCAEVLQVAKSLGYKKFSVKKVEHPEHPPIS